MTKDLKSSPNVFISENMLSGVMPNAEVAIEGSTKCLVLFSLIAVLLLRFGFHASNSSIT